MAGKGTSDGTAGQARGATTCAPTPTTTAPATARLPQSWAGTRAGCSDARRAGRRDADRRDRAVSAQLDAKPWPRPRRGRRRSGRGRRRRKQATGTRRQSGISPLP
ncbi:hypothetical protein HBB16_07255 [Pseudonocardia sp. MCCB 268]|nr:hypothetical protein [Pseudonocardia cytotoxica]